MSDVEHMSRKELLQPNQMEKKLYAFVDHAYRKKQLYIGLTVTFFAVILTGWGIWQYMNMQQIDQANRFHLAQSLFYSPNLSEDERITKGIQALKTFAQTDSDSTLGVLALMTSAEALAQKERIDEAIHALKQVQNHASATSFHKNIARLSLSALYEERKEWATAKSLLEAIDNTSWNDIKWRSLARIAIAEKQKDTAIKFLNQIIEKTPDSAFHNEAETLLLSL